MSDPLSTSYDSETRIETLYHCAPEAVRYQFDAADPSQPAQESWELLEKERLCFDSLRMAVATYQEYANQDYLLDDLFDLTLNQSILTQAEPGGAPQPCSHALPEEAVQRLHQLLGHATGPHRAGGMP